MKSPRLQDASGRHGQDARPPPPAPRLDADAAKLLAALRVAKIPRFETLSPGDARRVLAELRARVAITPPPVAEARSFAAPSPAGSVALRLYRPEGADAPSPCLVYLHGGGWVLGNLDAHNSLCRTLANLCGCVVIAVDYRLAPEHRFPAGLADACAAWRFVTQEAEALGLAGDRLALGGDSAGANLAAVIALMARDGELPPIKLQYLFYPAVDLTLDHPSQSLDMDGLAVTGPSMRWFRGHYLSSEDHELDWQVSPLLATSLAGVAPCHLVTAGVDPLCDEGLAYGARLTAAGIRLTHEHYPGQIHGFFTAAPDAPTTRGALASFALAAQNALNA